MDLGIEGRTALVTGASRGLGLGIAQVLAREGARVAMSSRSQERLEEAATQVEGKTAVLVADSEDLERMRAAGPVKTHYPLLSSPELEQVRQLMQLAESPVVEIRSPGFNLSLRRH